MLKKQKREKEIEKLQFYVQSARQSNLYFNKSLIVYVIVYYQAFIFVSLSFNLGYLSFMDLIMHAMLFSCIIKSINLKKLLIIQF